MEGIFFVSSNKARIVSEKVGHGLVEKINSKYSYFTVYPERFGLDKKSTTYQVLKNSKVQDFIESNKGEKANIIFFKSSKLLEGICQRNNYRLLSNPSEISDLVENKISQAEFLESGNLPRPFMVWGVFEDIDFYRVAMRTKLPFVLQFGRGHSGQGSFLITSQKDFDRLLIKYPRREIRCSKYFHKAEIGTINAVLVGKKLILGAPSLQITGVSLLTKNELSTVGNDWGFIKKMFVEKKNLKLDFIRFMRKVQRALLSIKYQGVFGVDFAIIQDKEKNPFRIIEINARFPASFAKEVEMGGEQLFIGHLESFLVNSGTRVLVSREEGLSFHNGSRLIIRDKVTNEETKELTFKNSIYGGGGNLTKEGQFRAEKALKE